MINMTGFNTQHVYMVVYNMDDDSVYAHARSGHVKTYTTIVYMISHSTVNTSVNTGVTVFFFLPGFFYKCVKTESIGYCMCQQLILSIEHKLRCILNYNIIMHLKNR